MNIPRRSDPIKRDHDRREISSARELAERYRDLRAFGLASNCITRLCDRIEELEAQVTALQDEVERLDPTPPFDDNALLDALEEIGRT